MLMSALNVAKKLKIEKEVILSRKIKSTIQKTISCPKAKRIFYSDWIHGTFTYRVSQEKINQIKEALAQKQIKSRFHLHRQLHDSFKKYENFKNLQDEKVVLVHQLGEVLCLNICSLNNDESLESLDYNQKLLQKHPHWKRRVRMIAIFFESEQKQVKQEVQKRKWNLIVHLLGSKQIYDNDLIINYQIWDSSANILIDKLGITRYIGRPVQIDLEKIIDQLISQSCYKNSADFYFSFLSEEQIQKYIANLSPEQIENQFKEIELFSFNLEVNIRYTNGQVSVRGMINANVMSDDLKAIEKVHLFFGNYPGIDLKIKTVDYIPVPITEEARCWQCNQCLKYPFYWLKWEEGTKFGCRKCIQTTSTFQNHHFLYEKNSVLLMGECKKIAAKNIGINIQPIHPKQIKQNHSYRCDGCGSGAKQIGKARYICQGCRMDPNPYRDGYRDFCEDCLEKTVRNELKFSEQLQSQGHQSNHPFLRVLYNISGYYLF